MTEHRFSARRDLLPGIKTPSGVILPGSPSLKERQKSARLPPPEVPARRSKFSLVDPPPIGGGRRKNSTGEAYRYIC
jgi:hypothetical protein